MTTSVAALRALENELDVKPSPACEAGHSLGEYTALVAAGVLLSDRPYICNIHCRALLEREISWDVFDRQSRNYMHVLPPL